MATAARRKAVLREGSAVHPLPCAGDKVHLHFCARRSDDGTVLDDTRAMHNGKQTESHRPFELRLGKKFVMPVWEEVVQTMRLGEVAQFLFSSEDCESYPQLATVLRRESKRRAPPPNHSDHGHGHAHEHGHDHAHHHAAEEPAGMSSCCASAALSGENRDLYLLDGVPLQVEIELLKIEGAGTFEKEMWEMSVTERLHAAATLKAQGNNAFKDHQLEAALEAYGRAMAHVESMETLVRTSSHMISAAEVAEVAALRESCLLNLAATELARQQYKDAIGHATAVLERNPAQPKALYRRAQAHFQRGRDLDAAMADAKQALALAPTDASVIKLMREIQAAQTRQAAEDRQRYASMLK